MAYKLELPESLKIHPVFHVSLLHPYQDPAMFSDRAPIAPPPIPITIDDAPEYEVEKILDHRVHRRHLEYLVKWVGYPEYDASWEPEINLDNAKESVEAYRASRSMPGRGGSDVMVLQSKEGSRDLDHVIWDEIPDGLSEGTELSEHREQGVMQG